MSYIQPPYVSLGVLPPWHRSSSQRQQYAHSRHTALSRINSSCFSRSWMADARGSASPAMVLRALSAMSFVAASAATRASSAVHVEHTMDTLGGACFTAEWVSYRRCILSLSWVHIIVVTPRSCWVRLSHRTHIDCPSTNRWYAKIISSSRSLSHASHMSIKRILRISLNPFLSLSSSSIISLARFFSHLKHEGCVCSVSGPRM